MMEAGCSESSAEAMVQTRVVGLGWTVSEDFLEMREWGNE